jgi:hypothetical protein
VNDRLIQVLQHKNKQFKEILNGGDKSNQYAAAFSFRSFQILGFDTDMMLEVLEVTTAKV